MISHTIFCLDWQVSLGVSQQTDKALDRGLALLEAKKRGDQGCLQLVGMDSDGRTQRERNFQSIQNGKDSGSIFQDMAPPCGIIPLGTQDRNNQNRETNGSPLGTTS